MSVRIGDKPGVLQPQRTRLGVYIPVVHYYIENIGNEHVMSAKMHHLLYPAFYRHRRLLDIITSHHLSLYGRKPRLPPFVIFTA